MSSEDVAIPLSELSNPDTPADGATLRPSQLRRVEALQVARNTLASTPAVFSGSKLDGTRSIGDLVALADWILFGSDGTPENDDESGDENPDRGF
jgi:hypothetical protein